MSTAPERSVSRRVSWSSDSGDCRKVYSFGFIGNLSCGTVDREEVPNGRASRPLMEAADLLLDVCIGLGNTPVLAQVLGP